MDSGASSAPRKLAAETLATLGAIVKVCAFEVPPPGAGVTTVTAAVPAVAMSAAVMAAVSRVALTKVVIRAFPFQFTVELAVKLAPLTVKVNAAPPATAMFGLIELVVGAGILGLMVNVAAGEEPPPGDGFWTTTLAVPAEAMSLAEIEAVTWVALTNCVVRSAPFHHTVELLINPVPFTVNVKAAPPAVAELGLKLVMAGVGLLIVKVCALEVPPPGAGVTTVTEAVPAVAMSVAGMAAVSCVALTKVVVRAFPFQFTVEFAVKLFPLTVRVNAAPPAIAAFGLIELVVGAGVLAVMEKVAAGEEPPPGAGFCTTTLADPAEATSAAEIEAVNCVALTNCVVRKLPFHHTVEALIKPVPLMVSEKAALPA